MSNRTTAPDDRPQADPVGRALGERAPCHGHARLRFAPEPGRPDAAPAEPLGARQALVAGTFTGRRA